MQKNWYRLDTAALIFPAIARRDWCNAFRVSATLCEPVDPEELVRQESEVEEVRYFDLEEAYEEACRGSERFCVNPNGMKVLMDFLGM